MQSGLPKAESPPSALASLQMVVHWVWLGALVVSVPRHVWASYREAGKEQLQMDHAPVKQNCPQNYANAAFAAAYRHLQD